MDKYSALFELEYKALPMLSTSGEEKIPFAVYNILCNSFSDICMGVLKSISEREKIQLLNAFDKTDFYVEEFSEINRGSFSYIILKLFFPFSKTSDYSKLSSHAYFVLKNFGDTYSRYYFTLSYSKELFVWNYSDNECKKTKCTSFSSLDDDVIGSYIVNYLAANNDFKEPDKSGFSDLESSSEQFDSESTDDEPVNREQDQFISALNSLDEEEMYDFAKFKLKYNDNPFITPLLLAGLENKFFPLSWQDVIYKIENVKVLNLNIYKTVSKLFDDKNINDDEQYTKLYSNFVTVVDDLTNHKLSVDKIVQCQDFLDDVLRCRFPNICPMLVIPDAGRLLVGLLDNNRNTSLLSLEEKRWFACAIIVLSLVGAKDLTNDNYLLGLLDFESTEHFRAKYNYGYGSMFFDKIDNLIKYNKSKPYGYSVENPILTSNIPYSNSYLSHLVANDGKIISCNRIGSLKGVFDEILDKYEITIKKGWFLFSSKEIKYIYINPYSIENSKQPPDGFYLE